jgi:hypothetical protein
MSLDTSSKNSRLAAGNFFFISRLRLIRCAGTEGVTVEIASDYSSCASDTLLNTESLFGAVYLASTTLHTGIDIVYLNAPVYFATFRKDRMGTDFKAFATTITFIGLQF